MFLYCVVSCFDAPMVKRAVAPRMLEGKVERFCGLA